MESSLEYSIKSKTFTKYQNWVWWLALIPCGLLFWLSSVMLGEAVRYLVYNWNGILLLSLAVFIFYFRRAAKLQQCSQCQDFVPCTGILQGNRSNPRNGPLTFIRGFPNYLILAVAFLWICLRVTFVEIKVLMCQWQYFFLQTVLMYLGYGSSLLNPELFSPYVRCAVAESVFGVWPLTLWFVLAEFCKKGKKQHYLVLPFDKDLPL